MKQGMRWALAGLIIGTIGSLGSNVTATALHVPPWGAYVGAVFWPVLLFVMLEVLIKIPWERTVGQIAARALGVGGAAFLAGWVSYWHGVELLTAWGYDSTSTHAGPLAVDGAMVMCTLARAIGARAIARELIAEREESERAPSERAAERSLAEWVASAPHERSAAERASDHQAIASTEPAIAIASTELDERARIERAIAELPDDAKNSAIAARAGVEWCDRSRFAIARARKRRAEQIGEGA